MSSPGQPSTSFTEELVSFAEDLRELRISCGSPPLRAIAKQAPPARPLSVSALSEAFAGKRLPRLDFLMAVVRILLAVEYGQPVGHDDVRLEPWRTRWTHVERLRVRERQAAATPGPAAPEGEGMPDVPQPGALLGESIEAMTTARAEQILADAQAERDQAAAELARAQRRIAEELDAAKGEARREREQAEAEASRIREEAEREAAARLAAASRTASSAADKSEAASSAGDDEETPTDKFPKSRVRRGQDSVIRLEVDLNEATSGTIKEIQFDTTVVCTTCSGKGAAPGTSAQTCDRCRGRGEFPQVTRAILGKVMVSRPCPQCQGFGTVVPTPCLECAGDGRVCSRRTLRVKIPAGVDQGTRILLTGEGEAGPGGGPAADLYVDIQQTPHPVFQRRGDNLHCTVTIPMTAAVLGTKVPLETLDGLEAIDIRPGTQSGQAVRLHQRGVTHLRGGGRGDLFIHIEVLTPTDIDRGQEELFRAIAKLRGEEHIAREFTPGQQGLFARLKKAFSDADSDAHTMDGTEAPA